MLKVCFIFCSSSFKTTKTIYLSFEVQWQMSFRCLIGQIQQRQWILDIDKTDIFSYFKCQWSDVWCHFFYLSRIPYRSTKCMWHHSTSKLIVKPPDHWIMSRSSKFNQFSDVIQFSFAIPSIVMPTCILLNFLLESLIGL